MTNPDEAATAQRSRTATGVVVVAMSIALWWPAFTLGAWGTLFFDQLLTVWAAATGAFVVVLIQPRGERRRIRRAIALLVPSLWLALSIAVTADSGDLLLLVVELLAGVVGLLGIPLTLWVLAGIVWPDLGSGMSWKRRLVVVLAVAVLAVISFELGVHQASFLTCDDFAISGNSLPPGCVKSQG